MDLAKRIFVGNLPYQTDERELSAWFEGYGYPASSVNIAADRLSGQPRGFGFVEMEEDLTARCIRACNGQDFLGRTLVVNEAHPLVERRSGSRKRF